MPTDDELPDELAPDSTRTDQPARDDLIEPEEIDPEPVTEPTMDEVVGQIPPDEALPETQGANVLDAQRLTEDATSRRLLSDEEAEIGGPDPGWTEAEVEPGPAEGDLPDEDWPEDESPEET